MLFRKIEKRIIDYLQSQKSYILLVDGARQVGKTYIIREAAKKCFPNFIELNMVEDFLGNKEFENVRSVEDFYLQVSISYGYKMGDAKDTLIFIDEIQQYPHLLTLLKFLNDDKKFSYIASGSLLGVTLSLTTSIPMGSIKMLHMYPLDFEEFLRANGVNEYAVSGVKTAYLGGQSLNTGFHEKLLDIFKKYLLVGGLPGVVNEFIQSKNMYKVRELQSEIHQYYGIDASKYDEENKLKIKRIYDLIPSCMENKKKRIVIKEIDGKKGKTYAHYQDEFDYLLSAGIATGVNAISNPTFPLIETMKKNLIKLYLNDVGVLTSILYKRNINAIMQNKKSINLGAVYETVVANELKAHNYALFYYDNRQKGEVDFLIDDENNLSVLPIEVKSGKDYYVHSALSSFAKNENYNCKKAIVLSNERQVKQKGIITYMPIYYAMFL